MNEYTQGNTHLTQHGLTGQLLCSLGILLICQNATHVQKGEEAKPQPLQNYLCMRACVCVCTHICIISSQWLETHFHKYCYMGEVKATSGNYCAFF